MTFTGGVASDQANLRATATSSVGSTQLVISNSTLSFVAVAHLVWVDVGGSSACANGTSFTVASSGTMLFEGP
jgi:hypothetical protein